VVFRSGNLVRLLISMLSNKVNSVALLVDETVPQLFAEMSIGPPSISPPLHLTNQIVLRTSGPPDRWYIYCIKANRWLIEDTGQNVEEAGSLILQTSDDLLRYSQFLEPDEAENLTAMDELLSSSVAVTLIGKVRIKTVSMLVLLIPAATSSVTTTTNTATTMTGVRLLFMHASHGKQHPNHTRISRRYRTLTRWGFENPGAQLFDDIRFFFVRFHKVVTCLSGGIHHMRRGLFRTKVWSTLTNGGAMLSDSEVRPVAVPPGQVVHLHTQAATRLKRMVDEKQFSMRVNYRGGKSHAPQRLFQLSTTDDAARRAAECELDAEPFSDFHLSRQQGAFFNATYSAATIVEAVAAIRREAAAHPHIMDTTEIDEVVNALSSSLYESIGWKLDETPPVVSEAKLSSMSVDIDQVTSIIVGLTFVRDVISHLRFVFLAIHRPHCTCRAS
jgi:hypothetical protein